MTLLCALTTFAHANEPSSQLQPLADQSLLVDIAKAGDALVAVGERGHVLIGKHGQWQQVATPTNTLLTKVFFLNDQLGWAVGHDATILHSQDGGLTWQLQHQSSEIEKPLLDVLFFNDKEGVAVGAYGLFFRTQDSGLTWREEYHDELLFVEDVEYLNELKAQDPDLYLSERAFLLPHFNRLLPLTDGRVLLVGELGLVALSDDQGKLFNKVAFDYDGSMFNAISHNQHIYVMGLRGNVFVAPADFSNWQQLSLPTNATINGATVTDDGDLWLVGNGGVILKQDIQGQLHILPKRQGESLVAITTDDDGKIWLAGSAGVAELQPSQPNGKQPKQ